MRQKISFLLLLIGLISLKLKADSPAERVQFYPKIFEDRTQILSVQEIISDRYDNNFLHFSEIKELHQEADYWGKVEVENTSDFTEKRFLRFGKNARISCYVFAENEQVQIYKTGTALPYAENDNLSNIIPLEILPNSKQTIVFRLKNPNAFPDFTLHLENEEYLMASIWESEFFVLTVLLLLPLIFTMILIPHSFFWRSISWTKMALITSTLLYVLMRSGMFLNATENAFVFTAFWVYSAFILVDIFAKKQTEVEVSTLHISREVFRALLPLFLAVISGFVDYSILHFLDIMIGWEILMSLGFALGGYFYSPKIIKPLQKNIS